MGGDCQISRLGMSHSHCFAPSHATLSLWICHFLYFWLTLNLFRFLTSSPFSWSCFSYFILSMRIFLLHSVVCGSAKFVGRLGWTEKKLGASPSTQSESLHNNQNFQFWPRYFRLDPVGPPLDPLGPCRLPLHPMGTCRPLDRGQ